MTEDSIEFQPMPGDSLQDDRIRKSFRVPASEKDKLLAVFYGKTYTVANISSTGIAIRTGSCMLFESGQVLEGGELLIGSQRLDGLCAKVIHCSVHDSGDLQFGLAWLGMAKEDRAILDKVLARMKARVIKQGQLPGKKG